jgi:hypothetical protein
MSTQYSCDSHLVPTAQHLLLRTEMCSSVGPPGSMSSLSSWCQLGFLPPAAHARKGEQHAVLLRTKHQEDGHNPPYAVCVFALHPPSWSTQKGSILAAGVWRGSLSNKAKQPPWPYWARMMPGPDKPREQCICRAITSHFPHGLDVGELYRALYQNLETYPRLRHQHARRGDLGAGGACCHYRCLAQRDMWLCLGAPQVLGTIGT